MHHLAFCFWLACTRLFTSIQFLRRKSDGDPPQHTMVVTCHRSLFASLPLHKWLFSTYRRKITLMQCDSKSMLDHTGQGFPWERPPLCREYHNKWQSQGLHASARCLRGGVKYPQFFRSACLRDAVPLAGSGSSDRGNRNPVVGRVSTAMMLVRPKGQARSYLVYMNRCCYASGIFLRVKK